MKIELFKFFFEFVHPRERILGIAVCYIGIPCSRKGAYRDVEMKTSIMANAIEIRRILFRDHGRPYFKNMTLLCM